MSVLSLSRLRRGLRSPNLFFREANRLYHRRFYTRRYNTAGTDIFAEDWDILVILDACRYDMFEAQVEFDGRLESRFSRGSSTPEFLRGNLDGRDILDTVYVTANPKLSEHRSEIDVQFHEVHHVWQDRWDETRQTVLPEDMTDAAIAAADDHPDKRLVIHYIQPHYPFLTEGDLFDSEQAFLRPDEAGAWHQLMTGELEVPRERVWEAYRSTLDRVFESLPALLQSVDGKTVLTADHGNMVGERARPIPITEWGHPHGIYTPQLVRVPWFVCPFENRRSVTEDPPKITATADEDVVADRLRQLGYTE